MRRARPGALAGVQRASDPNDILWSSYFMARPSLFLIDGSSQMYRAYHAFRGRGLSNQEGHTTHAVYVFVTMLR